VKHAHLEEAVFWLIVAEWDDARASGLDELDVGGHGDVANPIACAVPRVRDDSGGVHKNRTAPPAQVAAAGRRSRRRLGFGSF
jgi:hypothetical protein